MRRAVVAVAGTVAGLALLLGYKSSSPGSATRVALGGTAPGSAASTTGGSGSGPSSGPATTAPSARSSSSTSPPSSASAPRTYPGQLVSYQYGDIKVAITVKGGRIQSVTVPQSDATDPRSQMINSEAIPILEQEALSAQSLNFNVVSGATYTSDAFAQSLQSALRQAGK